MSQSYARESLDTKKRKNAPLHFPGFVLQLRVSVVLDLQAHDDVGELGVAQVGRHSSAVRGD